MNKQKRLMLKMAITLALAYNVASFVFSAQRVYLHVDEPSGFDRSSVPVTMGIPFPKGVLDSVDHVRVLDARGAEVPSQITQVSAWEPADDSIKWIWVDFFADVPANTKLPNGAEDKAYVLEYGRDVRRTATPAERLTIINNQSPRGGCTISTGPMKFVIKRGAGGFLNKVWLDRNGDGAFSDDELIADTSDARGSFVDIKDDNGIDLATANITWTEVEQGSGPLHAVVRVEGEYTYRRGDNNPSPFVLRVHAYAGKPYIKVLHTFVYTGVPDKHKKRVGQQAHTATSADNIVPEEEGDIGWTQPDDQIAAIGLKLSLRLNRHKRFASGIYRGKWYESGATDLREGNADGVSEVYLMQTGPKPTRMPPVPESTTEARLSGFHCQLATSHGAIATAEKGVGWLDASDEIWGATVAIRNLLEEYPKEINWNIAKNEITAFLWPARVEPMSFARFSDKLEYEDGLEGAVENSAQGLAKTHEVFFYFHTGGFARAQSERIAHTFLFPSVGFVSPEWYSQSGVYGQWHGYDLKRFPDYERAMQYKLEWYLFNQRWMPWYGMIDYGDGKLNFDGKKWVIWDNNEPAADFILWLQFLRTGRRDYYLAAEAASRHAMDVDNLHWPTDFKYRGDTNYSLDYFQALRQPPGSKFLGIGKRHAEQHWSRTLTAHVWVQGWLASYYLTGHQRGLDVAKQTGDLYLRRLWGEHDMTGRRLYLAVWNLLEVWDATKEEKYKKELDVRVEKELASQKEQGGNLVIDRYAYAQVYASQALSRYYDLTGDKRVQRALIAHARRVRDVPPLGYAMESYLGSMHSLVVGYLHTKEPSFLEEAKKRLDQVKCDPLARPIDDQHWTQGALFEALQRASHLPKNEDGTIPLWSITNGLRVFGWTQAYTIPYVLYFLSK